MEISPALFLRSGATPSTPAALSVDPGMEGKLDDLTGTSDAVPLVYEVRGLTAAYDPVWKESSFQVFLTSSGKGVGYAFARLKFDFDGDGVWDRTETWAGGGISAQNLLGTYANKTSGAIKVEGAAYRNLVNGRVRFDIWYNSALSALSLRTGAANNEASQSIVNVPYTVKTDKFFTREPSQRHAVYPESVLTSGIPDSNFGGGANAYPLTANQVDALLTAGLPIYRSPTARLGSCATCHSPDGFDLAKIGYSDDNLRREALVHLDPPQVEQVIQYIHALRVKKGIVRPLNPNTFRPLQPQFEVLPGANTVARDTSFATYLQNDVKLLAATTYVDTEAKALACEAQLKGIDLSQLKVGVPFDRWSEDKFHGLSHVDSSNIGGENGSVAEWLSSMVTRPKAGREAEYYAIFDQYAANPTDTNFWRYYDAIEDMTESDTPLTDAGMQLGYDWMKEKYRATQVATHMLRRDTIDLPKRTVDQINDDLAVNREIAIERNPLWRVGDKVRAHPFFVQNGVQAMTFPANVEDSIDPRLEARTEQSRILQTASFWAGWQADPALLTSDLSFATTSGFYFYVLNQSSYTVHYAFILAKMSVEKANATAFTKNMGDGVYGHGMWASIRPFLVYKGSTYGQARPGVTDPRYQTHSRIIGNSAAMWILLVDRDLRLNQRVYDAYGTLAAVEFARTLVSEMLPEHSWSEVDAALARIRVTLKNPTIPDVRPSFDTNRGLYHEVYDALGIPDASYQITH